MAKVKDWEDIGSVWVTALVATCNCKFSLTPKQAVLFSGERPSPGAAMIAAPATYEYFRSPEQAYLASAPKDLRSVLTFNVLTL
jgi:hypothetical protein